MSFKQPAGNKSPRGYTAIQGVPKAPQGNRALPNAQGQLSTSIEDIQFDMKELEKKIEEFKKMSKNLGTRIDNNNLRKEMKKCSRDFETWQNRLNVHIEELEEHTKSKTKDRDVLKQLSEVKRVRDKNYSIIRTEVDKFEKFIAENQPQYEQAYMDVQEIEQGMHKVNAHNANLQYNELLIRERHQDISAMTTDLLQVQDVFGNLAQMISDQGDMIDDIENNLTSAADQTKQGVKQILLAKESQRNSRTKCCTILIIVSLIVVALVGITLWIALSK